MSQSHRIAVLGLAALVMGAACAGTQVPTTTVSKARIETIRANVASFTEFRIETEVPIPAGERPRVAKEAVYEVLVGEDRKPLSSGKLDLAVEIPAEGGVVPFEVLSAFAAEDDLGSVFERTEPLPFIIRGSVTLDGGDIWEFTRAWNVRTPRVPLARVYHVEASAQQGEISLIFFVRLENQNPFEIEFDGLAFRLDIEGKRMIEDGKAGRKRTIPASSNVEVRIEYDLTSQNFPGIEQVIRNRRPVAYMIDGDVVLGVGHIPVELEGSFSL